jgi:hypothetical protein
MKRRDFLLLIMAMTIQKIKPPESEIGQEHSQYPNNGIISDISYRYGKNGLAVYKLNQNNKQWELVPNWEKIYLGEINDN